eukprot:m.559601 g.559601  ORF g.559601 m.559601 type:complete len:302 (+) comp22206_c0_seq5:69-974(+)
MPYFDTMEHIHSYAQSDFMITLRSAIHRTFSGKWPSTDSWDWQHLLWEKSTVFEWTPGVTPLSNSEVLPLTWATYWSVVAALGIVMSFINPFGMRMASAIHNLILLVWSAIMFLILGSAMFEQWQNYGVRALFCAANVEQSHPRINYAMYIFYLSKFYELLDTIIIRFKKRPLIFLHWYHHSIVLAMTWSWIHYRMIFGSGGMIANTLVHVFMYYYYFCASLGYKDIWFKKYITSMQLVQFATSFVLSAIYYQYSVDGQPCLGSDSGAFEFSVLANVSFFCLFAIFYRSNYTRTKKHTKVE